MVDPRRVGHWLKALFQPGRVESELKAELRLHLEEEVGDIRPALLLLMFSVGRKGQITPTSTERELRAGGGWGWDRSPPGLGGCEGSLGNGGWFGDGSRRWTGGYFL